MGKKIRPVKVEISRGFFFFFFFTERFNTNDYFTFAGFEQNFNFYFE